MVTSSLKMGLLNTTHVPQLHTIILTVCAVFNGNKERNGLLPRKETSQGHLCMVTCRSLHLCKSIISANEKLSQP